MLNLDFARDLVLTGAIFGLAAFVWAGWAQERPPAGIVWRFILAAIQVAGVLVLGFGITGAIRQWDNPSSIDPAGSAFVWYLIVFWIEVITLVFLAVYFVRTKRPQLIAPTVLIVVGVHFIPLTFVFGQPIIMLAAVLITAAGIAALLLPTQAMAPSFWCGILAGPVFVVLGAVALTAGLGAISTSPTSAAENSIAYDTAILEESSDWI